MARLPSDVDHIKHSFEIAEEARVPLEYFWADCWNIYNTKPRRERVKHRSNATSPHGAHAIRNLVPLVKREILSTWPAVRPRARKPEVADQEIIKGKWLAYILDGANLREKVLTQSLKEALIFGLGIGKIFHEVRNRVIEDEKGNEIGVEELYNGPCLVPVKIEEAFFDPSCRSFDELEERGYAIHVFWRLLSDLKSSGLYSEERLQELEPGQAGVSSSNVVPMDQLFAAHRRRVLGLNSTEFQTRLDKVSESGDALVEVMEYTAAGKVWTIANRSKMLREAEQLDHPFPWWGLCPDPIPGELYGKSIFSDCSDSLMQRDYVINAIYDNLGQVVHKMYKARPNSYVKGSEHPRPGGVIQVTQMDGFQELQQTDMVGSAFGVVNLLEQEIQKGSGLQSPYGAGSSGGNTYNETATVGEIKKESSLLFVNEMISQLESGSGGLKRIAKVISDIESEYWPRERWLELLGEEGARILTSNQDNLVRDEDWEWIGSQYSITRNSQASSIMAVSNLLISIKGLEPGAVSLRNLARTIVKVLDIPDADLIVPSEPHDMGPDVEHEVMQQGTPVKPEMDEDLQLHLQTHIAEHQRAVNDGEEPLYLKLLEMHIQQTQLLIKRQEEIKQAMVQQQLQMQMGGQNG